MQKKGRITIRTYKMTTKMKKYYKDTENEQKEIKRTTKRK